PLQRVLAWTQLSKPDWETCMKSLLPRLCGTGFALFFAVALGCPSAAQRPTSTAPAPNTSAKETSSSTGHPCLSVAQAASYPDSEICLSAHVYNVVEMADG